MDKMVSEAAKLPAVVRSGDMAAFKKQVADLGAACKACHDDYPGQVTSPPYRIRVWDLPTRIFHWTLAALVVFSFTTGKVGGGWMEWHLKSGYAILALLVFRLAWGFAGSPSARFARFLRGPRAALDYAREFAGAIRSCRATTRWADGW